MLILAIGPASLVHGQTVDRIDPPSWWVDGRSKRLTLLIEGSELRGAEVQVARGPIHINGEVESGEEGRALFVGVSIPSESQAGRCEFAVTVGGRTIRRDWDLHPPPPRRAVGLGPDDVIYLIMPDRFADGDPSNNEPEAGDRLYDRRDTHAYHGGDFAGLRRRLPYLVDLGVTAIWLTPIYRPAPKWFPATLEGRPKKMADFHGYCPVDFYDTNPRFGTPAEYRALVDEAHRLGLKVIQDQILGYTGPRHRWVTHPPGADWFHGPMDHPPACNFRFDAMTNPHAREEDRRGLTDGWFFGILPDLNVRNRRVQEYAIQQSLWWARLFSADGVRLDTYPMVDRSFWAAWNSRFKEETNGERSIGEAWVEDPADLSFFQGGRPGWDGIDPGVDSVFDFPLYRAATAVFSGKSPASALGQVLRRDGLYPHPEFLVTFLDNHDTPRLSTIPGVTPARLKLAIAFLLTTRGIPQITWGDEIGMPGHMDDRRDFPGGFPGDPRDAFTAAGRSPAEQEIFATYRTLLHLRKSSTALRRGTLTELAVGETIYAFEREHQGERLVVALNLGKTPATVTVPVRVGGSGPPERLYGEVRSIGVPDGLRLELPAESAAIIRLSGR
jgi:glycosidase